MLQWAYRSDVYASLHILLSLYAERIRACDTHAGMVCGTLGYIRVARRKSAGRWTTISASKHIDVDD